MKQHKLSLLNRAGFTIVELLIAISIISVILLLATTIFMHLGNDYTKGVALTNTQNATRNVMDAISQQIQFSGNNVLTGDNGGNLHAICIGTTRFSFVLDRQAAAGSTSPAQFHFSKHALWQDSISPNASSCDPLNVDVDPPATIGSSPACFSFGLPYPPPNQYCPGKELVPNRTSVTGLCVTPLGNAEYVVNVWLAYGDHDLLRDAGTGITCQFGSATISEHHFYCAGSIGDQFCAVSELTTTVAARL